MNNPEPRERASGPRIESRWHTDVTFMPNPPMGSILRGVVVPPYGGDTQWTNLAVAYRRLSKPLRTMIEGLHAVHHNALPIERGEVPSSLASTFQRTVIRSVHPVVRVHPETGERVLFVNPNFTSHIQELSRRESSHVLAALYDEIAAEPNTCRFRWETNSVAFWDNRVPPTSFRLTCAPSSTARWSASPSSVMCRSGSTARPRTPWRACSHGGPSTGAVRSVRAVPARTWETADGNQGRSTVVVAATARPEEHR